MSTPANAGTEEKKGGVSRILSRMRTVLKRSDGSKRLSLSGRTAATPAVASAAGPSTTAKPADATPTPAPVEAPIAPVTTTEGPQPVKIMRSQIDAERAKKLSERFKLTIEAHEFPSTVPDREALRVEKPIRMRIHRTCHKCDATFGGNKICASCQHTRCSKCPRYPVKKAKTDSKGKEGENPVPVVGFLEPDSYYNLRETYVLTMPSRTGGQPLVRKKPMQRVRRTCHQCSSLFSAGATICSHCGHTRCTDCPRDPAKKKKYPDGYPGDVYSATSTAPLKYTCHQCNKVFPPIPHPDSPEGRALGDSAPVPECTRCGHPKCSECTRAPIVKVEVAPDPEVVKSVEAKLAAIHLRSVPPTTT